MGVKRGKTFEWLVDLKRFSAMFDLNGQWIFHYTVYLAGNPNVNFQP